MKLYFILTYINTRNSTVSPLASSPTGGGECHHIHLNRFVNSSGKVLISYFVWLSWKRSHVEHKSNPELWSPLSDGNTLLVRFDKEEIHGIAPNKISVVSLHVIDIALPGVNIDLFSCFWIVHFRFEIFYLIPRCSIRYSYLKLCILQSERV